MGSRLSRAATARTAARGLAAAVLASAALALPAVASRASSTPSPAPPEEQTHPRVRPAVGGPNRVFTLTFTEHEAGEGEDGLSRSYTVGLARARGKGPGCASLLTPGPTETAGRHATVKLSPPAHGWCPGHYVATVDLELRPTCQGPPQQAADRIACPLFIAVTEVGHAGFFVRYRRHRPNPASPSASHPRPTRPR